MRRCLADQFPFYRVRSFTPVPELLVHLDGHLENAICICLDHDLELIPGDDGRMIDPGDGRQAAEYLATRPPQCPVVIHSTNTSAALGMEQTLTDAGWQVTRVSPFGDLEWIASAWLRAVRRAIVHLTAQRVVPDANGTGTHLNRTRSAQDRPSES
jgi:hypothetical protein